MIQLIVQRHQFAENAQRCFVRRFQQVRISSLSLIEDLDLAQSEVWPVIHIFGYWIEGFENAIFGICRHVDTS